MDIALTLHLGTCILDGLQIPLWLQRMERHLSGSPAEDGEAGQGPWEGRPAGFCLPQAQHILLLLVRLWGLLSCRPLYVPCPFTSQFVHLVLALCMLQRTVPPQSSAWEVRFSRAGWSHPRTIAQSTLGRWSGGLVWNSR